MSAAASKSRRAEDGGTVSYYRPAEVAKQLRCSEWWVKEQARRGRIPFSWIGGSYLFTAQHIAEIVLLFERRPVDPILKTEPSSSPTVRPRSGGRRPPVIRTLSARTPRRTRAKQSDAA